MEGYGVKAQEIRVVGGGSKNRLWRRIIADSFQLPLRFPTEPESAALGAALQAAAVHAGVATPEFIDSHSPPLADLVSTCTMSSCLSKPTAAHKHDVLLLQPAVLPPRMSACHFAVPALL